MPIARDVGSTFRRLLLACAALLPLSTGCTDSTQPVEPAVVEPSGPQPSPPPAGSGPAGSEHIYLANADGSATARLTLGSGPAWSRDGRRIAFQRGREVHVIDADGSNDIRLAAGIS